MKHLTIIMDANEHPAQAAGSFANEEVNMGQDLPNETSAATGSCDIFYAKWINAIDMYMKVPRRVVAIEIRQGTSQISRKVKFSI